MLIAFGLFSCPGIEVGGFEAGRSKAGREDVVATGAAFETRLAFAVTGRR